MQSTVVCDMSINIDNHRSYIFQLATTRKCRIFRGHMFSNAVTMMLFFSDVKHYVPVKLCKTAGSIHLFKIIGHLTHAKITLKRRLLWDVVQIY